MFLSLKSAKIQKHYKNYLKNFVNLVDFWLPWEQRLLRQQLPKNTPHWPHVYGCGIFLERRERKSHLRKTRKIFSLSCLEGLFGVFFEQNTHNQSHTQEPGLSCIYFQVLITVNYEQYQCTQTFQDERWKSPHWWDFFFFSTHKAAQLTNQCFFLAELLPLQPYRTPISPRFQLPAGNILQQCQHLVLLSDVTGFRLI